MDNKNNNWLTKPIHPTLPALSNEVVLFIGIMILAVITRFYDLDTRVMSHDESLHTYFSWLLYRGQGYQHTPMMHGPFQFHALALSYFLFGVSDFTARIPSVIFSIATVGMIWYWRRYLGNWGALTATLLMVISPYMLYYGRYVRNETFAGFSGILLLYAVLRYLETGHKKYLYMITGATVLHFMSKETAFIYTAQILFFLGFYFIARITRRRWDERGDLYNIFIIILASAVLLAGIGAFIGYVNHREGSLSANETAAPADPLSGQALPSVPGQVSTTTAFYLAGIILFLISLSVLIIGYGWANLKKERSFDIMILLLTFVLPMLVPFPIKWLESRLHVIIPTDAASVAGLYTNGTRDVLIISAFLVGFFIISIIVGQLWNREWWKQGVFFWGTFFFFYTTFFTNWPGIFTGLLGSLGYWLVQQSVERGSQPVYYYYLIQIPMYEFLPAAGSIFSAILGINKIISERKNSTVQESDANEGVQFVTVFSLLAFWSLTSIIAFSYAGERMPWLTYHMAWPMILLTGWGLGQLFETITRVDSEKNPFMDFGINIIVLAVFILAGFKAFSVFYSAAPPFQGTELAQLQATSEFLFPIITVILTGAFLIFRMKDDLASLGIVGLAILIFFSFLASLFNGATYLSVKALEFSQTVNATPDLIRLIGTLIGLLASVIGFILLFRRPRESKFVGLATLTFFGLLAAQTVRTSFRAAYINYDDATEYLVYAHGATGIKEVMSQVSEISERTAGGLNAIVAYDNSAPDTGVSWPFVWYLRDFTSLRGFDSPTRSLREAVAVIVDQKNFDKIQAALGNEYYEFNYIRMWWPNQDYFNLTSCGSSFFCERFSNKRIVDTLSNPQVREGIFDIWFNRDYTVYSQVMGSSSMTLTTWQPADPMKLFVRKDVAAKIWNYGVGPTESVVTVDPYEAGTFLIPAEQVFEGNLFPSGLNAPRSIAVGLNDDLYIADSRNHRIVHIASNGTLLGQWGTFADGLIAEAPIGTFNEPWGVAVGPDGSVYVTDTWNHRVQKFTKDGKPLLSWGQYGQPISGFAESESYFYGPRGIAVDSSGHVFVADTGNKRIVVFDNNGGYLTEFGTEGFDSGQFDEPVGVAVSNNGTVYVADTWNQRVQAFTQSVDGISYLPSLQWDVNAWFGQSLDNKPLIAVGPNDHVFITDPEGYRIIEFNPDGTFVRTWGDFGEGIDQIGLAAGVAVDQNGFVWVTDAGNNRILKFRLP